jgi:hypothetical protein
VALNPQLRRDSDVFAWRARSGGLVASWTTNQFQKVWSADKKEITGGKQGQNGGHKSNQNVEDATMKAAGRISQALQGCHLTKADEKKAGPVLRYTPPSMD